MGLPLSSQRKPDRFDKQSNLVSRLAAEPDIIVSVQVLNEVANVLMKKYGFDEARTEEILEVIANASVVVPMTRPLSSQALLLKKRHGLSWFDALIVAAALSNGCQILLSEDMQHGMAIDDKLTIQNPITSKLPDSHVRTRPTAHPRQH